jgi:hypothetical protein
MFDPDDRVSVVQASSNAHTCGETQAAWPESSCVSDAAWRKSSWSSYNGNCVEVAPLSGAMVGVRDTKDQGSGPMLIVSDDAWRSFVRRIKTGTIDL